MQKTKLLFPLLSLSLFILAHRAEAALTVGSASITGSGAVTLQPASGSNLNVTLAGAGDFAINTDKFYVDSSAGYVGIGTSTPLVPLQVVVSGTDTLFFQTWTGYPAIVSATNDGSTASPLKFLGSSYEFVAGANYKVGVWTSTPASALSVASNLSVGASYAAVAAPANGVIIQGNVGIGTTTNQTNSKLEVKDGHIASSQTTAPTSSVTGTGYSGASMGSNSTDTKGSITATVGANAGTLVVTFQTAYATAPTCLVNPGTATAQVDVGKMYLTTSTSAMTINFVASPTGGSETWHYHCIQ